MAVDERRRAALVDALTAAIGRDATVTLLEMWSPSGEPPATASQVTALEQEMDARFALVDQRFEWLRDEMLAAFRGELVTAVSGQTRAVIVATATAVFGIGGLAVTLVQVLL